jgi:hypothetical protein
LQIDKGAIRVDGTGTINTPQRLAQTIADINPDASADRFVVVRGRFRIVEVASDEQRLGCEVPGAVIRVRMIDGDHAGAEGWMVVVGRGE